MRGLDSEDLNWGPTLSIQRRRTHSIIQMLRRDAASLPLIARGDDHLLSSSGGSYPSAVTGWFITMSLTASSGCRYPWPPNTHTYTLSWPLLPSIGLPNFSPFPTTQAFMRNFVYLTEYDFKYKDPIGSNIKIQICFYRIQTPNRIMFKLTCLRFKTLHFENTAVTNEVFQTNVQICVSRWTKFSWTGHMNIVNI